MDAPETNVEAQSLPAPIAKREGRVGRTAGVPNNVTRQVREALALVAEDGAQRFWQWLEEIEDPYKRADAYLKALEFCVPRLARTEITGAEGGPVQHTYRWLDEGETVEGEVIAKGF